MKMTKRMGIDFGGARIGVAFSDSSIATGDHIFKSKSETENLEYFANLIKLRGIEEVVFGLPLNVDGTESEMSKNVKNFAQKLQEISGVRVQFQDERFTSLEAEEILKEAKIKWEKRKEILDKLSAQIILQNYLDENCKGEKNE